MTQLEEIGLRLSRIRSSKGVSRRELSDAIGYSETSIYLWETGKAAISVLALRRFCEYFRVGSEWILFGSTKGEKRVKTIRPSKNSARIPSL